MLAREFIPLNIKLPSPLWAHGDGGGGLSKIHIYYARLPSKIITDSQLLDRVYILDMFVSDLLSLGTTTLRYKYALYLPCSLTHSSLSEWHIDKRHGNGS